MSEQPGEYLQLKKAIVEAWRMLPPAHRMSMLLVLMEESPAEGWEQAAKDLNALMERVATQVEAGKRAPSEGGSGSESAPEMMGRDGK